MFSTIFVAFRIYMSLWLPSSPCVGPVQMPPLQWGPSWLSSLRLQWLSPVASHHTLHSQSPFPVPLPSVSKRLYNGFICLTWHFCVSFLNVLKCKPHKGRNCSLLLRSLLYPKPPEQYMVYSTHLLNLCWMNEWINITRLITKLNDPCPNSSFNIHYIY